MKLAYREQMALAVLIIILANILTDVFDFWLYRSIGWVICGLLFIANPVVPNGIAVNGQSLFWTRVAGVVAILIGVFTRAYY